MLLSYFLVGLRSVIISNLNIFLRIHTYPQNTQLLGTKNKKKSVRQ